ncbi:hypothetical protein E4U48_000450, partial [Claviceps purpurea]
MKSPSILFCGALLCNAVAAFYIPYLRSPSLWQADATATGSDKKPRSCLDGGPDDVALYNTSLPSKRSLDDSCGSNRTLVEQAYKDCATTARAGERLARAKNRVSSALLKGIFKDDSDETRNHVAEHLATIAVECEKNGEGITPVRCGFHIKLCDENPYLWGHTFRLEINGARPKNGTNMVTLCPVALHTERNTCNKHILGDVLLHEMSHSWGLTKDHAYGMEQIKMMNTSFSLMNADSYTIFAKSAKLGCVVVGARLIGWPWGLPWIGGNPSGEDNNNGNGNGNDNGSGNGNGNGNGNDGDNEKGKPKSSAGRQGGSGNMPNTTLKIMIGPCPYRKAIAPHSAVIATAIRPRRSTVIVTVTRPPTSTVIVTASPQQDP